MARESVSTPIATDAAASRLLLADQLAQRTHAIVCGTIDQVRAEVEFYRTLPEEAVRGDVTAITKRNFELLISSIRTGRLPAAAEFLPIENSARHRSEEEVPLAEVLRAYHLAHQLWWRSIAELAAAAGQEAALADVGELVHSYLQAATAAVLAGYGADRAPLPPIDHDRHTLHHALATGADPEGTARRLGLSLAPLYWVVAIHVDAHSDETAADIDTTVAARRKTRRLQRELDRIGRGETLCSVDADGGTALIPVGTVSAETPAPLEARFTHLREQLAQTENVVGARTLCTVDVAAPQDISDTLPDVRELLRVARHLRRRTGVLRFRDLAIEFQLSRPSRVTRHLASLLTGADIDRVIRETVEAYVWHHCNSTAAATALHVHPNTVLYRLRKASELTGIDFSEPRDLLRVFVAIVAATAPDTDSPRGDFEFD